MTSKVRVLLSLPLVLVVAAGCGKGGSSQAPARLSGKVTYKNAPLPGGTLVLISKSGTGVYSTQIGADGTYSITNVGEGDMDVTVETESLNPKKKVPEYKGQSSGPKGRPAFKDKPAQASPMPQGAGDGGGTAGTYVRIPPKYADRVTSGLTVTLSAGSNSKDFELTD